MSAKIILLDIETAPGLGWSWSKYDTNIIKYVQHWYMLSFAYKSLTDESVTCFALPDFPGYDKSKTNDFHLVSALWKVLDEADIVVAHNGDSFDIKKSNSRFFAHNLPAPSPYKTVDTLKALKKNFKFDSNKLGDIGEQIGAGTKVPHTGFSLWEACMEGDRRAWDKMREYNVQDVLLLEELYLKVRPWIASHPNVALYDHNVSGGTGTSCTHCGGNHTQRRGFNRTKTQVRQRHVCLDCRAWFIGDLIKK